MLQTDTITPIEEGTTMFGLGAQEIYILVFIGMLLVMPTLAVLIALIVLAFTRTEARDEGEAVTAGPPDDASKGTPRP
jgi:hypothetical protein